MRRFQQVLVEQAQERTVKQLEEAVKEEVWVPERPGLGSTALWVPGSLGALACIHEVLSALRFSGKSQGGEEMIPSPQHLPVPTHRHIHIQPDLPGSSGL